MAGPRRLINQHRSAGEDAGLFPSVGRSRRSVRASATVPSDRFVVCRVRLRPGGRAKDNSALPFT